jgi:hypothetical protein
MQLKDINIRKMGIKIAIAKMAMHWTRGSGSQHDKSSGTNRNATDT